MFTLAPTYSAYMYALLPHDVPGYEYEMDLIRYGDKLANEGSNKDFMYYKKAMDSIKQKQEKIGEGKDPNCDWMRAYTIYSAARALPDPKCAEKYLLEAKELAKKYYEIWKDDRFIYLYAVILENLGDVYFNAAESVRKGEIVLFLLKFPIISSDGTETNMLFVKKNDLDHFRKSYKCEKIVSSENFTDISFYYEIAKIRYEEFLKFYEEDRTISEILNKYSDAIDFYSALVQEARSNLEIINDLLKYQQKESSIKEEKKEEIINKNENNKKDIKEKKKETKRN
jgi:hypothetical protein